jgi:hypothetical protein
MRKRYESSYLDVISGPAGLRLFRAWTAPAGAEVFVTKDDGLEQPTRTRGAPWLLGSGTPVIALEGIVGGYALSRVRLRADPRVVHLGACPDRGRDAGPGATAGCGRRVVRGHVLTADLEQVTCEACEDALDHVAPVELDADGLLIARCGFCGLTMPAGGPEVVRLCTSGQPMCEVGLVAPVLLERQAPGRYRTRCKRWEVEDIYFGQRVLGEDRWQARVAGGARVVAKAATLHDLRVTLAAAQRARPGRRAA